MTKNFLAMLFLAVAGASSAEAASAQLIIANPSVKASETSKGDLKDLFTGASSTLGGTHLTPILLKASPTTDEFLAAYIGKSDSAFRASWRSLVFSGQATMPKSLDSDAAAVEYVAHNPGAIAYISKTSPHEGVKVLGVH